ncbi:DNA gyrase subunit B, partial [Citrobacter portucalensis]
QLENLVNEFRGVMKTLKRLSRLYPEDITEHFIYLPEVTVEQLGDHAAMQAWLVKFQARLSNSQKSGLAYQASLREDKERNVWLPEVEVTSHGLASYVTFNRDFFGSNDYRTVVKLGANLST